MKAKTKSVPHLPTVPAQALKLLAEILLVARKSRGWSQTDVAKNLGITRQTLARIEKGDSSVAIGAFFETAWLLEVPIFPLMDERAIKINDPLKQFLTMLRQQLPARVSKPRTKPVDDNF